MGSTKRITKLSAWYSTCLLGFMLASCVGPALGPAELKEDNGFEIAQSKPCTKSLDSDLHRRVYSYGHSLIKIVSQIGCGIFNKNFCLDFTVDMMFDSQEPMNAPGGLDKKARVAYNYMGQSDQFFAKLANEGYGAWDGCYGVDTGRSLIAVIHHPDDTFTLWRLNRAPAVFLMSDKLTTPTAVAHEITHGVVERLLGLELPGDGSQSNAFNESLADIFAILIAGTNCNPSANDPYAVCKNDNGDEIISRSLSNPSNNSVKAKKDASTFYGLTYFDDFKPDSNIYMASGIFSQAVYLMIEGGEEIKYEIHRHHTTDPVRIDPFLVGIDKDRQISREKTARILFQAINRTFIRFSDRDKQIKPGGADYTFKEAAQGIVDSCNYLRLHPEEFKGGYQFSSDDCEQVWLAFRAVNIFNESDPVYKKSLSEERMNPDHLAEQQTQEQIPSFWQDPNQVVQQWWQGIRQGISTWFDQQWQAIQQGVTTWLDEQRQIVQDWFQRESDQLIQQIETFFKDQFTQFLESICGSSMVPAALLMNLEIQQCRKKAYQIKRDKSKQWPKKGWSGRKNTRIR